MGRKLFISEIFFISPNTKIIQKRTVFLHFKFIDYTISGTEYNFVLKLANPTQHPTYIEFIDLEQYMINRKDPEEFEDPEKESTAASKPVSVFFLKDFTFNTKDT